MAKQGPSQSASETPISADEIIFIDGKGQGARFRKAVRVGTYELWYTKGKEIRTNIWTFVKIDPTVDEVVQSQKKRVPAQYRPLKKGGISLTRDEFKLLKSYIYKPNRGACL